MEEKYCYPCDEPVIDKQPPCPNLCGSKCPSYKEKPPDPDLTIKPFIWLIGGPGTGKGTQSSLIVKKYGLTPLSIGELVQAEIRAKTTRAKCFLSVVERGFPREERQGWLFEKFIAPVTLVLYFEASDETMTERLLKRHKKSTKICDNTDTIKIQLRKFHEQIRDIVPQYPHRLVKIDAERTTEQIFQDVQRAVDEMLHDHLRKVDAKKAKEKREKEEDAADSMFPKPKTNIGAPMGIMPAKAPPPPTPEPPKKPDEAKAAAPPVPAKPADTPKAPEAAKGTAPPSNVPSPAASPPSKAGSPPGSASPPQK